MSARPRNELTTQSTNGPTFIVVNVFNDDDEERNNKFEAKHKKKKLQQQPSGRGDHVATAN